MPLVLDLHIAHDRVGSSTDPTLNGQLRYSNNLDQSLNDTVTDKTNIVLTTTITPLTLYPLYRLLLVRLGGYISNLSDFYSYSLIGKLTAFFAASGVLSTQSDRGFFHYRRAAFYTQLKSKVGLDLVKAAALRITLNLDGSPIISKSHTHPSHSQTSRLLTSSLSLGIPVPRTTQCM